MNTIRKVDELNGIIRHFNAENELHREDGPAVVFSGDVGWYYLNGIIYSKENWEVQVVKLKLKRILNL